MDYELIQPQLRPSAKPQTLSEGANKNVTAKVLLTNKQMHETNNKQSEHT